MTIWVCNACGRTAPSKTSFIDVSCMTWAVECAVDKDADGNWVPVERNKESVEEDHDNSKE